MSYTGSTRNTCHGCATTISTIRLDTGGRWIHSWIGSRGCGSWVHINLGGRQIGRCGIGDGGIGYLEIGHRGIEAGSAAEGAAAGFTSILVAGRSDAVESVTEGSDTLRSATEGSELGSAAEESDVVGSARVGTDGVLVALSDCADAIHGPRASCPNATIFLLSDGTYAKLFLFVLCVELICAVRAAVAPTADPRLTHSYSAPAPTASPHLAHSYSATTLA